MDDTDEVDERSHALLTAGISKLDRTQHIKAPARGEPSPLTGEFDLVKTNRLVVEGVASVLENSSRHVDIGKAIKKTQAASKVLPKPLEKPQAERLKRSSAFDSARKKLGRWDATVARSRTVDFVSFPLKGVESKMIPTKEYLSKLKLKSELEQELDAVEGRAEAMEEDDEDEKIPMTYEEMLEHRQELAKLRAQQSFKAAKAKRQSKIKSKKYHRILKKERMKQQLKEFEELQRTDPEEALRRLESLERTRAQERHTLRHRNTGKWAKSKLVRAKYNPEVRQQLAEQLAVSRNLTHKVQVVESTDDESEKDEAIPDLTVSQDPSNSWMLKNSGKSKEEENFDFGYKKYVKEKLTHDDSSSEDHDIENKDDEMTVPNEDDIKNYGNHNSHDKEFNSENYENNDKINNIDKDCDDDVNIIDDEQENNDKSTGGRILPKEFKLRQKTKTNKTVATTEWAVAVVESKNAMKKSKNKSIKQSNLTQAFASLETELSKKIQDKIHKLREDIEKIDTTDGPNKKRKTNEEDNLSKLGFKNKKLRPIIDTELNETSERDLTSNTDQPNSRSLKDLANASSANIDSTTTDIDPKGFIAVKPKYLATSVPEDNDGYNNLDDEEQVVPKVNIEEVFEEDDVVASFRQEKEDEINKDKPTDVDLSLPGWGRWGGKGVKAPKRKRSRFVFKVPPKLPRRDENKGDIIIKEFKDPKLAVHKVTELPFPFTSVKDFEASIRAPLGNTFIPETAHKKVIKPSVFTKIGAIIEPMDDDELLVPKNQNFKNKAILKLLGNK